MKVTNLKSKNVFSGFIDVKIPHKGRKLGPWKAWKRQWCTIKKSTTDNFVELAIGNNCKNVNNTLTVPQYATLCRSESRTRPYAFGIFLSENQNHHSVVFLSGRSETESQQWMANIRSLLRPHILPVLGEEFSVSLIDNSFSRSTGLYGIFGILNLNETEMVIRNPTNGEVTASWKWSEIEQNYVRKSPHNVEDLGKIFVFQVRYEGKEDFGGKLCLFCLQAEELQSAVTQHRLGRQYRLVTSPLPPTPHPPGYFGSYSMRRLSRSEGDLRWPLESSMALLNLCSRSSSRERNSKSLSRDDKDGSSSGKIAKSLILASASFSLLLSTPGCSDPDSLNEYQAINHYHNDCDDNNDNDSSTEKSYRSIKKNWSHTDIDHESETDDLGELFSHTFFRTVSAPCGNIAARRVSGASVASGIYAEIDENPENMEQNAKYQNLSDFTIGCSFDLYPTNPPPLPPRKTNECDVNRCALNVSPNSFNSEIFECNKNIMNEQNEKKVMSNRQQSKTDDSFPESEYIMVNVKDADQYNSKGKAVITIPPPLPPRRFVENTENGGGNITTTISNTINVTLQGPENCDKREKNTPQFPEPDYLPMAQVPIKMAVNDDTYVVMANTINNKMAIAVSKSTS